MQEDSPLAKKVINIIYHWKEEDVWNFISCNLIDYCSLYDEGWNRLGCVGCPLQGDKNKEKQFERWPLYKKAYIRAFDRMLEHWKEKGKPRTWQTGEEVFYVWTHRNKEKKKCK